MKFVIAALFGLAAAESPDCPESTQVFSYNERSPAATGFVQLETACGRSNVDGVRCLAQFATGMNGDEDLGEDITMKGEPFHFNQRPANSRYFATGMNGDEDLGEDIQMKGEPFHFNQNLAQFATGMNGDEDLGEDIQMKGEPFHFNQENQMKLAQFATGMNGDEDLGEDIQMKGEPFHFNQRL